MVPPKPSSEQTQASSEPTQPPSEPMQASSEPTPDRAQVSIPTLLLALVGLALVGFGTYAHFSVAGATRCDGCTPWHPLFVLAPLVGGVAFVAAAGLLYAR